MWMKSLISTILALASAASVCAQQVSGGGSITSPGGTNGQVQINSGGTLAGANLGPSNDDSGSTIEPSFSLAPVSGNWYTGAFVAAGASSSVSSSTLTTCSPFMIITKITVQALGVRITAAGSSNIQLAVYANSAGFPSGTPLMNTGNIADTSAANVSGSVTATTLTPGVYWGCSQANDATAVLQTYGTSAGGSSLMGWAIGGSQATISTNTSSLFSEYHWTSTYGTWPSLSSSGATLGAGAFRGPLIQLESQ